MKNILKKYILIIFLLLAFANSVYATNKITKETAESLNLNDMLDSLSEYTTDSELGEELDLSNIAGNLIVGKSNDYSNIIKKITNVFVGETVSAIKNSITILIIIVVMGIFSSLEIDKNSSISKIVYLVSLVIKEKQI